MAYPIELMSVGEDNYALLARAAAELNGIQKYFNFVLTDKDQRADGLVLKFDEYLTTDIYAFLQAQRAKFGGYRPFIIAFVNGKLKSPKLSNLFGSHEAGQGMAVVTAKDAGLYVKEIARFYCYYLVRYTLSFMNPHIKAHNDAGRAECYFHQKIQKRDIQLSLDSGKICDSCKDDLINPPAAHSSAKKPSTQEMEALQKMLAFVSQDLPHALVMNGGGVKGLAFAGALLELEKFYWFDRHVGTSAGAIAAVLLAAAYTPTELTGILRDKNFKDFMDAGWWEWPTNLLFKHGVFPGEACRSWIEERLRAKFGGIGMIPMSKLNGAVIFAAQKGVGTIMFNSMGKGKSTDAAFAARCSMAIPYFFMPQYVNGRPVYDGGIRANFPLANYLAFENRSNFIAMYLGSAEDRRKDGSVALNVLSIALEGEERAIVDANIDKVMVLDTSPIGTVDFNLSSDEKNFLLSVGKAAALAFLAKRQFDEGPTEADVTEAVATSSRLRKKVIAIRQAKRDRFWGLGFGVATILALAAVWLL